MSRKKVLKYDKLKNFNPVTTGDRINYIIAAKQLTGTAFCKIMRISSGNLNGLINDDSKPSAGLLARLLDHFGVNINWLLNGEGEKYIRTVITGYPKGAFEDEPGQEDAPIYNKVDQDEDPEIVDLLSRTMEILKSGTDYSASLAVNIRSFHHAVKMENEVSELKSEMSHIKRTVATLGERQRSSEKIREDGDRRKGERRLQNFDPPNGLDHRSGSERRKNAIGE